MERLESWMDAKPWRFTLILFAQTAALLTAVFMAARF
jgi:hypothetical protein